MDGTGKPVRSDLYEQERCVSGVRVFRPIPPSLPTLVMSTCWMVLVGETDGAHAAERRFPRQTLRGSECVPAPL